MFFPESEAIALKHPNLRPVIMQVDQQLSGVVSGAAIRPTDFACALGADENQVISIFERLAHDGVLKSEKMIECDNCHNLMPAETLQQAIDDEDPLECTACSRAFPRRTKSIVIYRATAQTLNRTRLKHKSRKINASDGVVTIVIDEPLSDRAQEVLVAMLQLNAVDSDSRQATAAIAARAMGADADANSYKPVISELATRQLVKTREGRGGGCWLTGAGKLRAEKLNNS